MNLYKPEKLRIGLKAYDSTILDESCNKIIEVVSNSDTKVVGPIPLPTKRRIYCVLRSPHVNNKSKEIFYLIRYRRLLIFDKIPKQLNNILQKAPNDLCIKVFLKS